MVLLIHQCTVVSFHITWSQRKVSMGSFSVAWEVEEVATKVDDKCAVVSEAFEG
jgi:hypothetical protein